MSVLTRCFVSVALVGFLVLGGSLPTADARGGHGGGGHHGPRGGARGGKGHAKPRNKARRPNRRRPNPRLAAHRRPAHRHPARVAVRRNPGWYGPGNRVVVRPGWGNYWGPGYGVAPSYWPGYRWWTYTNRPYYYSGYRVAPTYVILNPIKPVTTVDVDVINPLLVPTASQNP